jgi:PAS domain-containing protein
MATAPQEAAMTSSVHALIADTSPVQEAGLRSGIALVSPTGHVNLANQAFWSMLGRNRQRAVLDQFILPEDRNGFLTVMSDLAQGAAGPAQLMLRFALPDGNALSAETLVSLVRVDGVLEQFIVQLTPIGAQPHCGSGDQQFSQFPEGQPVSFRLHS